MSQTLPLFNLETSASTPCLSPSTIAAIKALLKMGMDKQFSACLLELAGCSLPHQRYLAGPLITHNSGWQDTIPQWLLEAIPLARFESIATEIDAGEIGELATPEEALAVMYPATMQAPLSHRWYEVYMYLGNQVLTQHQKLPPGQTFWELMGINHPITYAQIRQDYEELARDIRQRVVLLAAERGVGKRQRKSLRTNQHQPVEQVQPEPTSFQQLSLFD